MGYEIKENTEILKRKQQEAEEKALYGDRAMEPVRDLPTYRDMGAVKAASSGVGHHKTARGIIYKVIGLLVLAALGFGIYLVVKYVVGSGGQDISNYLTYTEVELADHLNLTFEDHNERASKIQQYSGGTVTVRSSGELEVIYINGEQVGVATDGRDYRFFGVGVNEPEKDMDGLLTFKYDYVFHVINDLMGGNSQSYYYCDTANNRCLVLTVSDKTHRVVYMTFFTDLALISKELSF